MEGREALGGKRSGVVFSCDNVDGMAFLVHTRLSKYEPVFKDHLDI